MTSRKKSQYITDAIADLNLRAPSECAIPVSGGVFFPIDQTCHFFPRNSRFGINFK